MRILLAVLGALCDDPTGTVNPVCWKLLAIAGTGYVALGTVIGVLAKKLWDMVLLRHEDQLKINEALKEKKGG